MCRSVALVLALSTLAAGAAHAQVAIPDDIPDKPEALDDKQKKRFKERYRETLSPFFVRSGVGTALSVGPGMAAVGVRAAAGFDVGERDALYLEVVHYTLLRPRLQDADGRPVWAAPETVSLISGHYEASLHRVLGERSKVARRLAVAFGIGADMSGSGQGLSLSVEPRYEVPVNTFLSLPVGVRAGGVVLGDAPARHFFVGVQAGVKVHFIRHERLE